MMLEIQFPTWLVDIWSAYSDVIVPALMAIVLAVLTWVAVTIKADAKSRVAKSELELQTLKQINDKEDTRPELNKMQDELMGVKQSNKYLAEMIDLAFQHSTLDDNTKNALTVLKNKLLFGVEEDLVLQLTEEKTKLEEKCAALEQELSEAATVKTTETRTRR